MVDSPAVVAAEFRLGRVLCISPHLEQTAGLEDIVPRVVEWVSASKNHAGKSSDSVE